MELRRAVMPLTKPLQRLAEATPDDRRQVRSTSARRDHLTRCRRWSLSSTAAHHAGGRHPRQDHIQQNTDMRKISAWVAIISTPAMIAGITA